MKILNTITNTNPCILHAYGASHFGKEWEIICDAFMKEKVVLPEDITIVSFFYGDDFFALKKQMDMHSVPYIDASKGFDLSIWQHRIKIKMIAEATKTVKTKYVLILDGIDVLLSGNIQGLLDTFNRFNCKLLYNSCVYSHPLSRDMYGSDGEEGVGIFDKLNSGAFLGETQFVKEYYLFLMNDYEKVDMPTPETDGVRIGITWKDYGHIKVDHNCEIFQTLLGVDYSITDSDMVVKTQN